MSLTSTHLAHLPETLKALQQADDRWANMRQAPLKGSQTVPQVVITDAERLEMIEYDVVIAGGTLGIAIAAALAMGGFRVAVIERGLLRGRDQEWNISRHELDILMELKLLTPEELETTISSEFNPIRVKFGDTELWTEDVLNIGVDPVYLLETVWRCGRTQCPSSRPVRLFHALFALWLRLSDRRMPWLASPLAVPQAMHTCDLVGGELRTHVECRSLHAHRRAPNLSVL